MAEISTRGGAEQTSNYRIEARLLTKMQQNAIMKIN